MTLAPRPGMTGLLNSKEAAAAIRVSERTLRDLRKAGLIAYVAVTDRLIMYRPEDCEEYLASRLRRDEPCNRKKGGQPPPPRRTKAAPHRGNVITFEALAQKRGW